MVFSELVEKILRQTQHKYPFALYHLPDSNEIILIAQQNSTNFEVNYLEKGFVFAPFAPTNPTYFIPLSEAHISEYSVEDFLNENQHSISSIYKALPQDKEAYLKLVNKTIETLKNSNLQKVVISKHIQLLLENCNESFLISVFQRNLKEYFSAFSYLFYHPDQGFWMGATPEKLIVTERNQLKTVALAGTQLYQGNMDVSWGEKEDKEQQYVVDAILDALEPFCEKVKASEKYTKKAGNLLHLNTDISAVFTPSNLQEIVEALHPTPAVCGLPKDDAMNFIIEHENNNRQYYTGFLGELNIPNHKPRKSTNRNQELKAIKQVIPKTQLFVNLRCMHIKNESVHIFVGGGITEQSNPEKEWQETEHKSQTMLKVL